MDLKTKQLRLEEFERLCRDRGIPCTVQRRVIYEAVLVRDDHPSADQVLQDVCKRQRGISRATVHRNLENWVRMGLITKACHQGNVTRYDARLQKHHHLVCLHCDKVIDFKDSHLDAIKLPDTTAVGFAAVDYQVHMWGICQECQENG